VLLMSPLAQHGRDANLIADIVKAILDHQGQEYDAFTPITMDLPETAGIEPDYCFYIDHWQAISGKKRISWVVDPPPDLIIEIDLTLPVLKERGFFNQRASLPWQDYSNQRRGRFS
jgi:Uma2 family endonuclease